MKVCQLQDILTKIQVAQQRKKKEVCIGKISELRKKVLNCLIDDG